MMSHSWDLRRASALAGVLELDTPWDGGTEVGSGVAAEARRFGASVVLLGSNAAAGTFSWAGQRTPCGARGWSGRVRAGPTDVAGSIGLLRLAEGLDPRTTVSCTPGGDCRPAGDAFQARHRAVEEAARRLAADGERGSGSRVRDRRPSVAARSGR